MAKWTKLSIKTTTEAEDVIISEMYDLGLMGAQIEDHVPLTPLEKEQMFVDILPDTEPDDGRALLHFFVEVADSTGKGNEERKASQEGFTANGLSYAQDNSYSYVSGENVVSDLPGLIEAMKEKLSDIGAFMDIGEGTIEVSGTEDKDWENNWKEFFKPFSIEDLHIVPSWADEDAFEDTEGKILRIDPGSAFGTGMHETTQLCIMALKEYVTGDTVLLDVGTGSGILGITALLYGAKAVTGTDLDICAIDAVKQNVEENSFSEDDFKLIIGNIITDEKILNQVLSQRPEGYDIVIANILAEVLTVLTPVAYGCLKKAGIYITSGILEGKEDMVRESCEKAGLKVLSVRARGEWRCVVAIRE